MATLLLLRLAQFTDRAQYREAAEKTLALFGDHMHKAPHVVPQMLCALDFYLSKPKQIAIAGKPLMQCCGCSRAYLPNKVMCSPDDRLAKLMPYIKDMKPVEGKRPPTSASTSPVGCPPTIRASCDGY